MKKYIVIVSIFSIFLCSCIFPAGDDVAKVKLKAGEAMEHGNYRSALNDLLSLSDNSLEKNDSLMLMLSEAYYGLTGKSVNLNANTVTDMEVSPDGKWVYFTDLQNGKVLKYSLPEIRYVTEFNPGVSVYDIDLSSDGSHFVAALSDGKVGIYDTDSGKPVKTLTGHTNRVRSVVYTDENHIVSGGNDQYLINWDASNNKLIDRQWPHRKNIKKVRRSVDGNYVVSASNDGTAIVWNFTDKENGKEVRKVKHGINYVNDAVLSPDNSYLVTVSGDGDAKIWNSTTGTLLETIPLEDIGSSVDFSPDGKHILIGGYEYVHVVNADTRKVVGKFPAANDAVWGVAFLDDGRFAFADSSHFYEAELLTGENLIKAAREWLKQHNE